MNKYIIFPELSDGTMATPSADNYNGFGLGFCFEVAEFEPQDLNEGRIGYQFQATEDDLGIVHPDGSITKEKGKVVKLSTAKLNKIVDQQKFEQKQRQLIKTAKYLIGKTLVVKVGSITDQLNAGTTSDSTVKTAWVDKFALRDQIKFVDGKRLKEAIRTATTLDQLENLEKTMTDTHSGWADGVL